MRNIFSLPVGVHLIQNGLKFRVSFSTLHEGYVVTQRAQARFELLMFQFTAPVLVKMPAKVKTIISAGTREKCLSGQSSFMPILACT